MKHFSFLLTSMLFIICCNSYAQVTITTQQLNGTKWERSDIQYESTYSYTDKEKIWKPYKNNDFTFVYHYYLASSVPTGFNHALVGKDTKGCYIVQYNPKTKDVTYYTIMSFDLDKGKMVLFVKKNGWIGSRDQTMTYRLIK